MSSKETVIFKEITKENGKGTKPVENLGQGDLLTRERETNKQINKNKKGQ